jgi:DNA-binding MarR family transcriptional regulator
VERLKRDELELWHAWKRAGELVRSRVVEEITAQTGLSDPDFGVLSRVVEQGGGSMRQNKLATAMGYHRSRLSHHLSRMEQRGLVTRRQVDSGVEVVVTDPGRAALSRARPIHAVAVRHHLVDPLTVTDREALLALLKRLTDPE